MLLNCLCHRICRIVLATNPSNPKEFLILVGLLKCHNIGYKALLLRGTSSADYFETNLHKDLREDLYEDLHENLREDLHENLHEDLHEDLHKDLYDCFVVDIDRTLCRIPIPR